MRVLSADLDTMRPPQIELDHLVPANNVLALTNQVHQKVEGLRLDGNHGCATA